MKRKIQTKEIVIIVALLLVLIFAAYWNFVQRPVSDALTLAAQQKGDLELSISALSAKKQKMDDMKAELEEIKASGNAPVIPDYDNLENVTAFLYKVLENTRQYSLAVSSVQNASQDSSYILRRGMSLAFEVDSYFEAKEAMQMLQDSEYCCRLGAMSMGRMEIKDSKHIMDGPVSVNLSMTFFEHQKG